MLDKKLSLLCPISDNAVSRQQSVSLWSVVSSSAILLKRSPPLHGQAASRVSRKSAKATDTTYEDKSASAGWKTHSIKMRSKMGMPVDVKPWTSQDPELTNVSPTPRCLELLDIAYFGFLQHCQQASKCVSELKWFVDVSQAVQRTPWSVRPGVFTQSAAPYSFHFDRVLDSEDRTKLQACQIASSTKERHTVQPKSPPHCLKPSHVYIFSNFLASSMRSFEKSALQAWLLEARVFEDGRDREFLLVCLGQKLFSVRFCFSAGSLHMITDFGKDFEAE